MGDENREPPPRRNRGGARGDNRRGNRDRDEPQRRHQPEDDQDRDEQPQHAAFQDAYPHQPNEPGTGADRAKIPRGAPIARHRGVDDPVVPGNIVPYPPRTSYQSVAMTASSRRTLADRAPEVPFTVTTGPPSHTHPVSHTLRYYHAYKALDTFAGQVGTIVDIGGKPSMWDWHPSAPRVHSTRYLASAADHLRDFRPATSCRCAATEQCAGCTTNVVGHVMIHSLYYFTQQEIAMFIRRAPLVAVVHVFDGFIGMVDELNWQRQGHEVICHVAGEYRTYQHSALDWLYGPNVATVDDSAFTWTCEPLARGTMLVTFRAVPVGTIPDGSVYPPQTAAHQHTLAGMERLGHPVRRVGPFSYLDETTNLLVHVGLLHDMVAWWTARPVNPRNLADAVHRASGLAVNTYRQTLNTIDVNALCFLASQIAAEKFLHEAGRLDVNAGLYERYNRFVTGANLPEATWSQRAFTLARRHPVVATCVAAGAATAALVTLGLAVPGSIMTKVKVAVAATAAAVVAVAGAFAQGYMAYGTLLPGVLAGVHPHALTALRIARPIVTSKLLAAVAAAGFAGWGAYRQLMSSKKTRGRIWRTTIMSAVVGYKMPVPLERHAVRVLRSCGYIVLPSYCPGNYEVKYVQKPEARVKPPPNPHDRCRPSIGSVLTGFAFYGWEPLVARGCSCAEHAAIVGRVTIATPYHGDIPAEARASKDDFDISLDLPFPPPWLVKESFNWWLSTLDGPKRDLYLTGWNDMPSTLYTLMKRDTFVKRENNIKGQNLEAVPTWDTMLSIRPRAIQSCTPFTNLTLGSFTSSFMKTLETFLLETPLALDIRHIFVYTMSPNEYAAVFQDNYEMSCWKDPVLISLDLVCADASTSSKLLPQMATLYKLYGCEDIAVDTLLESVKVRGASRHGIRYSSPSGTASGFPTTTANHSLTSYAVSADWSAHRAFRGNKSRVAVFNKSDDHLLIMEHADLESLQDLINIWWTHGFAVTYTVTRHVPSAEFLSLRLMPGRRWRAVPKIGRTMSKLFWAAYPTKIGDPADHVATVCHGLRQLDDVPVLGAILSTAATLSTEGVYRPDLDDDARWRHDWSNVKTHPEAPSWSIMRGHFRKLYGISFEQIHQMEAQVRAATELPWMLSHEGFDTIIKIDLGMLPHPQDLFSQVDRPAPVATVWPFRPPLVAPDEIINCRCDPHRITLHIESALPNSACISAEPRPEKPRQPVAGRRMALAACPYRNLLPPDLPVNYHDAVLGILWSTTLEESVFAFTNWIHPNLGFIAETAWSAMEYYRHITDPATLITHMGLRSAMDWMRKKSRLGTLAFHLFWNWRILNSLCAGLITDGHTDQSNLSLTRSLAEDGRALRELYRAL